MEERENVVLGTIGGILGALVASVLWIILGQVGFIAGIAGFLIVFCSVKGYNMLGKNISRTGVIICIVVSVIMIITAEYVSTGIEIYRVMKEDYIITVIDSIKLVPSFLEESEVRNSVLINLAIGFALATWASFSFVKKLWKGTKAENNMQGSVMVNGIPMNNVQPDGTWVNNTQAVNQQQGGMRINGVPVENTQSQTVTVPYEQHTTAESSQNSSFDNQ